MEQVVKCLARGQIVKVLFSRPFLPKTTGSRHNVQSFIRRLMRIKDHPATWLYVALCYSITLSPAMRPCPIMSVLLFCCLIHHQQQPIKTNDKCGAIRYLPISTYFQVKHTRRSYPLFPWLTDSYIYKPIKYHLHTL